VFHRATQIYGIKYWAIWYPMGTFVPRYDVCSYAGYEDATGMHAFINHRRKGLIYKNINQIEAGVMTGTFKPFLLDMKQIQLYTDNHMPR
jgi:hypothetical protein